MTPNTESWTDPGYSAVKPTSSTAFATSRPTAFLDTVTTHQ